MPEVSVLIPLYGNHHGRAFLPAVTAAWLAQDVSCEVVIATAGDLPSLPDVDPRARVVRADPAARAPGLLRNAAAEQATSRYLYLSDADLAPLGRDYLSRAFALADGRVLGQPWMHRLLGGPQTLGPTAPVDHVPVGEEPFCFAQAGPDGSLHAYEDERVGSLSPAISSLGVVTPNIWPPAAAIDPGLSGRHQWRTPFHWGSLLLERELFHEVGGYCCAYIGWGAEDDDLLVKVSATVPTVRAWQLDRSLTCLHFEHPAGYFGTPEQQANQVLHTARLASGAATMIEQDRAARRLGRGTSPSSLDL